MTSEKKREQCSEDEEENGTPSAEPKFKIPRKSPNKTQEEVSSRDVRRKILEAQTRVKEKEDILRKLRLVKMYRTKWEMQGLDGITGQWLQACQEALVDLRGKAREMRETGQEELTLKMLIDNLGLDSELLKLDEEEDCFMT